MSEYKPNAYVQAFRSLRLFELFEPGKPFHKLRRKNTFWKEITEAYAVRSRLKGYLIKDPEFTVVDVGCGKGFLSTFVALMHPRSRVIALDIDESADRTHFERLKNVEFKRVDIMSEEFERVIREAGPKVLMAGIHLCTDLAVRFLEVFKRSPNVKAAVLMPCCVGEFPRERYRLLIDEGKLYEAWCLHLANLLGPEFKVKTVRDENVLSPKNVILHAERQETLKV
ncbi:MAG: methyltransferase [Aquificae bacterium]|nr:methyltransferase [Aquificota bacterium]